MGRCSQPLEKALFGEEEGRGVDGEEGAFTGGIGGLDFGEGFDEAQGFAVFLEHFHAFVLAAGDDQDVEFLEAFMGFFKGDVGGECDALGGEDLFGAGGEGYVEGFGFCATQVWVLMTGRVIGWGCWAMRGCWAYLDY